MAHTNETSQEIIKYNEHKKAMKKTLCLFNMAKNMSLLQLQVITFRKYLRDIKRKCSGIYVLQTK